MKTSSLNFKVFINWISWQSWTKVAPVLLIFLLLTLFITWEVTIVSGKRLKEEVDDSSDSSTESLPSPIRIKLNDDYRSTRYKTRLPPSPSLSSSSSSSSDPQSPQRTTDHLPSPQNLNPALLGNLFNSPYAGIGGIGSGLGGVGLGGLNGGLNGGLGLSALGNPFNGAGLVNFQNPYTALQTQLLLFQEQNQGLLMQQGLFNNNGNNNFNQALLGQQGLFNGINNPGLTGLGQQGLLNPYLSGLNGLNGNLGLGGLGGNANINPYLLAGRSGLLNGGLGIGTGNFLAQSLLNPYNSYNSINPYNTYPFASRFGVGRDSHTRSNSNANDDE